MKTNHQSRQDRIRFARRSTTLAVLILLSCSQNIQAQQHNLTRTLPTAVNSEVDIGDFVFTNGTGSLWISVTVPSNGYSVAKEYLLPIQDNQSGNEWQTALPASSTGPYNGNDFALDVKANGGIASLRLRTTASNGSAGTAYIVIKQEGANDTFTGSTSTSAVSAPSGFFGSTALTQIAGKVGIGTTNPISALEVQAPDAAITLSQNGVVAKSSFHMWNGSDLFMSANAKLGVSNWERFDTSKASWNFFMAPSTGVDFAGIRRAAPGAGSITWSDLLRITSAGNVGIGTAAPAHRLDVQGNAQWIARFKKTDSTHGGILVDAAAGYNPNLALSVNGTVKWYMNSNTSNGDALQFWESGGSNPRFTLTQAGNVGIGTQAPAYKLDVAGIINSSTGGFRFPDGSLQTTAASVGNGPVTSVFGRTGAVVAATNDYTWAQINKSTSSLSDLTTRNAGDLNAGTVPIARLGVSGIPDATTFLRGDNTWATVTGGTSQWTTTPGTNNISYNSGNVGIGTTTPDLAGFGPAANRVLSLQGPSQRSVLELSNSSTGTSGVGGQVAFENGSTQLGAILGVADGASNSGYISLWTNNAGTFGEKLRVDKAGNVGIGTTSPGHSLEVAKAVGGHFNALHVYNGAGSPHNPGDSVGLSLGRSSTHIMGEIRASNQQTGTYGDGYLSFSTRRADVVSERVRLDNEGRVGIGKTNPTEALDVVGNITATGNISAKYQDVAEWVESSQELFAGTLVVLDHTRSNQVIASSQAYDTRVAGVISERPGIILGETGDKKVLVATTGRVRLMVDASNGPIQIGDLLVTSDIPGVAMKSQPLNLSGIQLHRPGTLIGKALEPLEKGCGKILVLLSLQ